MKKLVKLLLCGLLITALTACNKPSSVSYKEGTYTAQAQGNNAMITVEVTLSKDAITNVVVTEHQESPSISDAAISDIPKAIVEFQTLNVDAIAGATVSSKAVIEAAAKALQMAGVDTTTLQTKAESNNGGETLIDATYDVVVLGAGGAGLAAAIEAKLAGASVILVEKMSFAGGNTLLSYAELAAPNSWLQLEKGIEDSPELMANEMYEGGGSLAKKELVDLIASNALSGAKWLRDDIGVIYQDYLVHEGGHSVPRAVEPVTLGAGMIDPMVKYAKDQGVEIVYNVKAEELIMTDGVVTGVKVSSNGNTATLTATNGVVVATGGFGANVEMREQYNNRWATLDASVLTTNSPAIVGEGILMSEKVGANLIGMEHIQLYPFNNPLTGVFYGIEAPSWSGEGLIYVNKEGNRFVNEVAMRDVRAEGILAQGGTVYAIYNQAVADRLKLEEKFADEYAKCLEGGVFFKADTLEELAKHFDINPENLVTTMADYNQGIANNTDKFGRVTSMVTMEEGPWFILEGVVSVHHTMGGVEIDAEARVLNAEGQIIKGLYAAGEATGGIHGNNRVGTCAISDIVVFGRIAGVSAATKK